MTDNEIIKLKAILATTAGYINGAASFSAYARAITDAAHEVSCCSTKPTKIDAGLGVENDGALLKNRSLVEEIQTAAQCLFNLAVSAQLITPQEALAKSNGLCTKINQTASP